MSDLISREELYDKIAEWEAQALHMVEVHMHDEDKTEWKRWSIILTERSAFKFDVADMPSAERVGKWNGGELGTCSVCGHWGVAFDIWAGCKDGHYCPNCGARMEGEEE